MSLTPMLEPESNGTASMDEREATGRRPEQRSRTVSILLAIALAIGVGEGVYAGFLTNRLHEMEQAMQGQITKQEESLTRLRSRLGMKDEELADLQMDLTSTKKALGKAQVDLRKTRLATEQLAKTQQETAHQISSQLGVLSEEQDSTRGSLGSLSSEVIGVRGDVSSTRQDLADTRSELQRVIGDLGVQSGLVAHNREELAELRRQGEREYYEFDLRKTRQAQKFLGGVALQLRKTDVKRQKYTVDLIADDRRIEKKDKTANEPVQFYQMGERVPTEIVVNQIYKDRIVGYISTPKQKAARLESLAQPGGSGS